MLSGQYHFTTEEQNGYALFQAKCATCHTEPLFTDFSYRNIGLPVDPSLMDEGLKRFTGKQEDYLRFRVPSLRNLASSSYYTHDGRFNTIRAMLNHYRTGVQNSPTLDPLVQGGIALTDTEVTEMVAFLRTLTDSSYLIDPRYARPQ
jgi:cytochrome c peroxidase